MRIFITGATGFVSTEVVHELINFGHKVVGLARSKKQPQRLSPLEQMPILEALRTSIAFSAALTLQML
jgi:uncharacterized protein YbjT (DUF2867 family)